MVSSAYSEVPNGTPPTRPKLRNGTVSRVVIGVCNSFSNNYAKFTALMHGNPRKPPPFVIWQEGNWQMVVGDEVRRKYDASGGAATACVGYGNHRVRKAMKSQIDHVAVTNELAFRTKISEKFSRALIATTDGLMAKVFVCNSGSDATETAAKLAVHYHNCRGQKRGLFISRLNSYHGSTVYCSSLSGHQLRRGQYEHMWKHKVGFVSACNPYRDRSGRSDEEYVKDKADELERMFQEVGPDQVAAFIAEPVVGAALGCAPAVPGYLKAMKKVCENHGALFIADEVMCGAGRTGTMHAWQQEDGFVPDIQTMGKAITGGYATVGVVLASHKVWDVVSDNSLSFNHGFTYQGHTTTCAAGLEILNIIRDEKLLENVRKIDGLLHQGLTQNLYSHKNVGNIRGRGAFWAIELVKDKATKEPFPFEASDARNIARRLIEKGLSEYDIYFYTGTGSADGRLGDHIMIAPAYNSTEKEIDYIIKTITKLVTSFFNELEDA